MQIKLSVLLGLLSLISSAANGRDDSSAFPTQETSFLSCHGDYLWAPGRKPRKTGTREYSITRTKLPGTPIEIRTELGVFESSECATLSLEYRCKRTREDGDLFQVHYLTLSRVSLIMEENIVTEPSLHAADSFVFQGSCEILNDRKL